MAALLERVNKHFPTTEEPVVESPLKDIEFVVVYTRLSRQDDKSHSPETQLRLTKDLAVREKWQVLKDFTQDADEPISGKAFDVRLGWESLENFLRALPESRRRKTAVLVKSFDRFSRNLEEGLATERRFREDLHVRLRASEMPYTAPEAEEGRLMFIDILKFAEYERMMIVKRTKQGLVTAAAKGRHLGHFPKHFTKDAQERIIPTDVADTAVSMRAEGRSYDFIASALGVPKGEVWDICKFVAKRALTNP